MQRGPSVANQCIVPVYNAATSLNVQNEVSFRHTINLRPNVSETRNMILLLLFWRACRSLQNRVSGMP